MKSNLQTLLRKAKRFQKSGELSAARDCYREILDEYPSNKFARKALDDLQKFVFFDPNKIEESERYQTELIALYENGQLEEAAARAEELLASMGEWVFLWKVLGASNAGLGKHERASDCFEKAEILDPQDAEIANNLGVALFNGGRLDAARKSLERGIKLNGNYAEARNNLGNVLVKLNLLQEARAQYEASLAINPNYPEALNNYGLLLAKVSETASAVDSFASALRLKPDFAEAQRNFSDLLTKVSFLEARPDLERTILVLLNSLSSCRPITMSRSIMSLVKQSNTFQTLVSLLDQGEGEDSFNEIVLCFSSIPLLLDLMHLSPLPDIEIERLLTAIRKRMLFSKVDPLDPLEKSGVLFEGLAIQCFINEYCWLVSKGEADEVERISNLVQREIKLGGKPSSQDLLRLGCYRSLLEIPGIEGVEPPDRLKNLFRVQVSEPHRELAIREDIEKLSLTTDATSTKVQAFYERNPYPRWIRASVPPRHFTLDEFVDAKGLFLTNPVPADHLKLKILVAGCGTGQQSIEIALNFPHAKVIAVDISLASLSYAKRKGDELGIGNIDYKQCDLLELHRLNERFDVVYSSGVLHHMLDPMNGWRHLTEVLKPLGLMNIGLYSSTARQHISRFRENLNITNESLEDIGVPQLRLFREEAMASDDPDIEKIAGNIDFFSTSNLRDLVFHVSEKLTDLKQLEKDSVALGLKLVGCDDESITTKFRDEFGASADITSWELWVQLEEKYPDIFMGMYQFWYQRSGIV